MSCSMFCHGLTQKGVYTMGGSHLKMISRKKMSTATPRSVGIIRRSRLTMYLITPARSPSFGEPHRVELLVQVVARRDRPAPDLGVVRDDPMPLERDERVRLLVEQATLELP